MYINASNHILLTIQFIPSNNLTLKRTNNILGREKVLPEFIENFCLGLDINFRGNIFFGNFLFTE